MERIASPRKGLLDFPPVSREEAERNLALADGRSIPFQQLVARVDRLEERLKTLETRQGESKDDWVSLSFVQQLLCASHGVVRSPSRSAIYALLVLKLIEGEKDSRGWWKIPRRAIPRIEQLLKLGAPHEGA